MFLRCGVVQFQHAAGARDANFAVVERFARQAHAQGVKVLAFPEMCLTGYWHARHLDRAGWEALSEPVPEGPATQRLLRLSRELDMILGVGLVEQAEGRLYNSYVLALPDGRWHRHRKLHAFESPHISSGGSFTVFDTPLGVRLGVLICYDTNIVENVRATALLGCDVLLAPHQTGGTASRSPHGMKPIDPALWHARHEDPEALRREFQGDRGRGWLMRWLPSRAHDNGLFLLFANGVGLDDDEVRTGNAMILDPYGRILAETQAIEDDLVVADLDLLPLCTGRRWIRGRRPSSMPR
ncbi:nitrilase family protein [Rubellimicrobium roseum]|uniref:nitrilase family protein n=1 Tax=Rubellimicrobium roseum TaxID=687525 RepID=UPI001C3F2E00|nr:nitrilase family protein [Rubellimicrobium roseum]